MDVFVVDMSQQTIILKVEPTDTIAKLKKKIKDRKGFPADQQHHLFYRGRELEDDRTFGYYNIENNSTLNMALAVPGKYIPVEANVRIEPEDQFFQSLLAQVNPMGCLNQ